MNIGGSAASAKRWAVWICLIGLVGLHERAAAQQDGPASAYRRGMKWWVPAIDREAPSTTYEVFWSETIDREVGFLEYLPPGYNENPGTRYPVLYWLHGLGSNPTGGIFAIKIYNQAIRDNKIPPMIVIACNGVANSWYLDSEDGEYPVETVIVRDLVRHVDGTRRTVASRDGRIVEGFSMGGYGAMRLGLKYPEVFGAIGAHGSGRFDRSAGADGLKPKVVPADLPPRREQSRGRGGPLAVHSAQHVADNSAIVLLERNQEKLRRLGLKIWMGVGELDRHARGALLFGQILEEAGLPNKVVVVPGVPHHGFKVYDGARAETLAFINDFLTEK